jgi:putative peptidoglycan lipid II flippase
MQLPLGLFGVAIASATLPAISRSAAAENWEEFRRTLSRSLGLVFLLTIPSSVGLVLVGRAMIGAVYQGGKFDAYDTQQTGMALSCFAIGLAGYAALKVLSPAFYALKDARTPMMVSLGSVVVNYGLARTMVDVFGMGHAGLAISTSGIALFSSVTLFLLMRRRMNGLYGRLLWSSLSKAVMAALGMAVVVWGIGGWTAHWPFVAQLAVAIPAGAAAFYVAARLLGVEELAMATDAMAGPLKRRLPFLRGKV